MPSETVHPPRPDPARGLPPVVPPSGNAFLQLLLVPALIVAGIVGLCLVVSWFVGSSSSPATFLSQLDNSNPEVRWRAANDLAQVLLRDDRLASDPKFALDLCERLHRAIEEAGPAEQQLIDHAQAGKETADTAEPNRKTVDAQRNYILYLSACVSNCSVPVGLPLLSDLALNTEGGDAETVALRRRRAVWALANLGENLKRFDQLPAERREAILQQLTEEAAGSTLSSVGGKTNLAATTRADWAHIALVCLQARQAGQPRTVGVDEILQRCSDADDPFVREMAAYACNFWQGDAEENHRLEDLLVKLTSDDGRGVEEGGHVRALEVRYNAAIALARRGSDRSRLDLLEEMLDEQRQLQNFHVKAPDGSEVPDQVAARTTVVNALKAIVDLHRQRPGLDLSTLRPAIEALQSSSDLTVRTEAEHTLQELGK